MITSHTFVSLINLKNFTKNTSNNYNFFNIHYKKNVLISFNYIIHSCANNLSNLAQTKVNRPFF